MIDIARAPGLLTVQDTGRPGHRADGVPLSGVMDCVTTATLNCMLGNARSAAVLELALGEATLEFDDNVEFAFGGAGARSTLNDERLNDYTAYPAERGDVLSVGTTGDARFVYLAFAGGIDCEQLLGSRSTYLPGGWGGIGGRRLVRGDRIALQLRDHAPPQVPLPDALRPSRDERPIRIVARSPRDETTLAAFVESRFTISPASDRTGYRLDGTTVPGGASIVSEPVCPGVIQLPPGGQPIVLMTDAPTIGGYRNFGCVITADRSALAQRSAHSEVAFEIVSLEQAEWARVQQDVSITAVEAWFRLTLRAE